MSEFKKEGVVFFVGNTEQATQTFKKRVIVLETESDSNYPQKIAFEFTQDAVTKLDGVKVGQLATIHFNLRGRDWTNDKGETKYFNTIQGWRIEVGASASSIPQMTDTTTDELRF